jgi:hypothetical protein
MVVVGAGSVVSSLSCALPATAELGAGICAVSLQNFLIDLRTLQGRNIQNTLLEPRRNLACCNQSYALLNLICMATVHLHNVGRLCRGEETDYSHS